MGQYNTGGLHLHHPQTQHNHCKTQIFKYNLVPFCPQMAKKHRTTKQKPDIKNKTFIRQVSVLHGDRLHVEVPKNKRDGFAPGDIVRVEKID